ncbi:hypothetical protein GCM10022289_28230 [Pedobacter jeongneungensis]|uniref:YhcG N-terminal domain-containing protein n=1 Tax=Pedobacter jeongneungensis TaxID=947309 RepID=A0ABP8BHA1_9SPHI
MESITNYSESIKALKSAILSSRYKAAALVNKELLLLYFTVGKFISEKVEKEKWGAKVIDNLSNDLQLELPGLRGFSGTNIKRMRFFFESWQEHVLISPSLTDQLQLTDIQNIKFSPSVTDQLEKTFFNISFTHHIEILQNSQSAEERTYYIQKAAIEFCVSTYTTSQILPKAFKGLIPDAETFKKLMD